MKLSPRILSLAVFGAGFSPFAVPHVQAADFADVIVVVDESGSMSGEHAWLAGMITQLNTQLNGANVGTGLDANRFALVGFGGGVVGNNGRLLAGFGDTNAFSTATGNLVISGGTEDGYAGINFGLDTLTFRGGAALNVILVTDEDRDVLLPALTYASTLSRLNGAKGLLNAVVNNPFSGGSPLTSGALGVDADGNAYFADGAGGFTTSAGAVVGNGSGNTENDYVALALAAGTGGAAWNLNLLRNGGLTAQSFTEAFVEIKVGEIIGQEPNPGTPVPEPSTYGLIGAVVILGLAARRRFSRKITAVA